MQFLVKVLTTSSTDSKMKWQEIAIELFAGREETATKFEGWSWDQRMLYALYYDFRELVPEQQPNSPNLQKPANPSEHDTIRGQLVDFVNKNAYIDKMAEMFSTKAIKHDTTEIERLSEVRCVRSIRIVR